MTDFLVETLALADPEVAMKDDVTVRDLLDVTARRVEEAFASRPVSEARVRATIGQAYASLSENVLAEAQLRRAAEILDRTPGVDGGEHYRVLWALTYVLFRLDHDDSYTIAHRAREVGLAHVARSRPELGTALERFRCPSL